MKLRQLRKRLWVLHLVALYLQRIPLIIGWLILGLIVYFPHLAMRWMVEQDEKLQRETENF